MYVPPSLWVPPLPLPPPEACEGDGPPDEDVWVEDDVDVLAGAEDGGP